MSPTPADYPASRIVKLLLSATVVVFCGILVGFFSNLQSTIADASTGGSAWTMQIFHNMLHGRPFQSSLYASLGAGSSVGFSHNPHAYIHAFVIHVNLTPYLLAPLWNLHPTLSWLYGLVFLLNYGGWSFFAWKILRVLSPGSAGSKTALATALLLASGFFFTLQQKAQPLLFSGPLILAAYYGLLRRRPGWFLAAMGLLCLTSEDAVIFAGTFTLYLALFEPSHRRPALWVGALSLGYLAVLLLIVQPAARAELTLLSRTNMEFVFSTLPKLTLAKLRDLPIQLLPAWGFLPAFAIAALLFGRPAIRLRSVAGLILIAPLVHLGEIVLVSAGHHLMPVISCLFLALILVLGSCPDVPASSRLLSRRQTVTSLLCTGLFILLTLRAVATNVPAQIRPAFYRLAGRPEAARALEQQADEVADNRRVLDVIRTIPPNRSLVFLINSSLEGFIAARSDLWKFPDYYDVADLLVIQRRARHSFFTFTPMEGRSLASALQAGRVSAMDQAVISEAMVQAVIIELVTRARTHRLAVDEPSVVVLERLDRVLIPNPPSTRGWGWWRHVRWPSAIRRFKEHALDGMPTGGHRRAS